MKWFLTLFNWILDIPFGPVPEWGDDAKVQYSPEELRKINVS